MSDATRKPPIFLTGQSTADLHLRVRRPGEDLAQHLGYPPDMRAAFENLAKHYEEGARKCRRLAGLAAEVDDLSVIAEFDRISVRGPVERIEALVREGILEREPFAEERERETYRQELSVTLLALLASSEAPLRGPEWVGVVRGPTTQKGLMGRLEAAGWWKRINPEFVRETLDWMVRKGEILLEGAVYHRSG